MLSPYDTLSVAPSVQALGDQLAIQSFAFPVQRASLAVNEQRSPLFVFHPAPVSTPMTVIYDRTNAALLYGLFAAGVRNISQFHTHPHYSEQNTLLATKMAQIVAPSAPSPVICTPPPTLVSSSCHSRILRKLHGSGQPPPSSCTRTSRICPWPTASRARSAPGPRRARPPAR